MLNLELMLFAEDTTFRLNGCGLVVLNPPWGFDADMSALLPELATRLGRSPAARGSVEWLVAE